MDIDELQTVQSKERQKDSLQHLRDSFYEDVAAYIQELKAEREQVAERADEPFSDPEVSRLTDDIERAEDVVEAVYERRVGKVVKMASFAAADMPVDEEGLTTQERDLFEDMVGRIGENRSRVLDIVAGEGDSVPAAGGAPGAQPAPTDRTESTERTESSERTSPEPEPEPSTTDSPDHSEPAVGTGTPASSTPAESSDTPDAPPDVPTDDPDVPPAPPEEAMDPRSDGGVAADSPSDGAGAAEPPTPGAAGGADAEGAAEEADTNEANEERTTVRVTEDVGRMLGVDDREYELQSDDVVALPADNADALLEREAAERLW